MNRTLDYDYEEYASGDEGTASPSAGRPGLTPTFLCPRSHSYRKATDPADRFTQKDLTQWQLRGPKRIAASDGLWRLERTRRPQMQVLALTAASVASAGART